MSLEATVLEGRFVRLEPLAERHAEGLREAIRDGELWKLPATLVPHPDEVSRFIAEALDAHSQGVQLAFATVDKGSGRIAGSTRFMNVRLPHLRTEIGFTFLGRSWQRTRINTEAKLLMLAHAFEQLGLNRVELLTDSLNTTSRTAIARLGAQQEGVLRSHMLMRGGRVRDSVIFSIIREEWPGVRARLSGKLGY
jgi:N-acetyltransferase